MGKLNRLHQLTGWLVFAIAAVVYLLSAERTGSLWDCGEFVLGAYKMQVVHPPGAPLFLLIGRIFAGLGDLLGGDNQALIAYAVNAMSGICTAFAAAFVAWITIRLSILVVLGRDERAELGSGQTVAVALGGLVAGLATAFSTSIWFSAVEGEVYAMSTFFTCLTVWAMVRWYCKPDTPEADRWLLFALFASGLSIGVHLLSILTIPAMAIFYYFKKRTGAPSALGLLGSVIAGVVIIVFIQAFIIVGIPTIWQFFEIPMVNSFGLPVHSGIIPTLLLLGAAMYVGLRYAHRNQMAGLQQIMVGFGLLVIAFSTVGVVVLRAEAKTPVNMNNPDNVTSLLPYLNREQYGERSLIYGQTFTATVKSTEVTDRYGLVDDEYEKGVTQKITPEYSKKMFFSRMYDNTQGRVGLYKQWMGLNPQEALPRGRPNQADNIGFFVNYQLGWMYWRYFMWNFSGRQNGEQGYYSWDESAGNWITGINFLDEMRLGNLDELPENAKNNPARNRYYLLPFLFGLVGLFWHAKRNPKEFLGLLTLFVITGIGIIVYTNQPPNEPRERDYVLVGSFFTFCIWMGMSVPALYGLVAERMKQKGFAVAGGIGAVILIAPLLMGFQNWDDHSRALHSGARDYAHNFLESVDEQAIIFTYGDNDTYPLWYAQEVEGIRPDVRVVNLSLIAVDWYIDLLRYKMNDSEPINLSLSRDQLRGRKRNQVPYLNRNNQTGECARDRPQSLAQFMQTIGASNPVPLRNGGQLESQYASCNVGIQVDPRRLAQAPWLLPAGEQAQQRIPIRVSNSRLLKDEIAILDIINANLYDRPIYWAVTCQRSKLMGLESYLDLEGLGLKLTVSRNQGEENRYGIIGSGGVNTEKTADLVLNKWKWGNFDTEDTHVVSSYAPAVQSMQIVIERTVNNLVAEGKTEEALNVADQYFTAFPDMNFPYYYQTYRMLQPYFQTQNATRASAVIEQLARNTVDRLDYYNSLDPDIVNSSYASDVAQGEAIVRGLLQQIRQSGDTELQATVEQIFGAYLYLDPSAAPTNPG
ncbi:MAG: DUF2723 domain-containing protein [Bacteroidota bacterium]